MQLASVSKLLTCSEDINRIEEEGRLNVSCGEFQLRMGVSCLPLTLG